MCNMYVFFLFWVLVHPHTQKKKNKKLIYRCLYRDVMHMRLYVLGTFSYCKLIKNVGTLELG